LGKKAFQSWYNRVLRKVPISRLCHPVVYGATYTSRIFDVTGTNKSPILYHPVGKGSFLWLGLPRDYLLLGSDTGSDRQNSLREDPTYDLVRLTLAFHDPKRAGAERASSAPLSGWGQQWNQDTQTGQRSPDPMCAWFAWKPIYVQGWLGQLMNGDLQQLFLDSLQVHHSNGDYLPHHDLILSKNLEGSAQDEVLDLATQAFAYALHTNLGLVAQKAGQTWLADQSLEKAAQQAADLQALLTEKTGNLSYGHVIHAGSHVENVPTEKLLPELVWSLTEISPASFPGGATTQTRIIQQLALDPALKSNGQALAAFAVLETPIRADFVNLLPQYVSSPRLLLIGNKENGFDLATAIPSLHAWVLQKKDLQ
jgi:hypothetical protein